MKACGVKNVRLSLQPLRLRRPFRTWAPSFSLTQGVALGWGCYAPLGLGSRLSISITALAAVELLHLHLPMVGFTAEIY